MRSVFPFLAKEVNSWVSDGTIHLGYLSRLVERWFCLQLSSPWFCMEPASVRLPFPLLSSARFMKINRSSIFLVLPVLSLRLNLFYLCLTVTSSPYPPPPPSHTPPSPNHSYCIPLLYTIHYPPLPFRLLLFILSFLPHSSSQFLPPYAPPLPFYVPASYIMYLSDFCRFLLCTCGWEKRGERGAGEGGGAREGDRMYTVWVQLVC
jgi:hypothetical protein